VPGVVVDQVAAESPEIGIEDQTKTDFPDYKVIVVGHGKRLMPPTRDYEHVAEFKYRNPFDLEIQLQFLNPSVHVYQFNTQL
jgi:hypothetical protein